MTTVPTRPLRKGVVLIVEDEPALARAISGSLERNAGFKCLSMDCTEQALERVRKRIDNFEFIIVDLNMPMMSGTAMITSLREEGFPIPALIISGDIRPEDEIIARHLLYCETMKKPFNMQDLLEKVQLMVEKFGIHTTMTSLSQAVDVLGQTLASFDVKAHVEIALETTTASLTSPPGAGVTTRVLASRANLEKAIHGVSAIHVVKQFWGSWVFHSIVWPTILLVTSILAAQANDLREHAKQIEGVQGQYQKVQDSQTLISRDLGDIKQVLKTTQPSPGP